MQTNTSTVATLRPAPECGEAVVRVPLLANAGGMGPGAEIQHDDVLVGRIFSQSSGCLGGCSPPAPRPCVSCAYGDSIGPHTGDGGVLLVDTGVRPIQH